MIELTKMLAAIKQCEAIGKPQTEYRLHPDDYEALVAQTSAVRWQPVGAGPNDYVFGLRIVQDPDAPRLPRVTGSRT
jgi:hypothetical protein